MGRPRKLPRDPFEKIVPGKIKVESKAYGPHYRAPRGSVTEAVLNEKMEETRLRTLSTNNPAKLINDALKPFRADFKGGLFFQYMQKHFSAQAKRGAKFNVDRMILGPDYHLRKLTKWWLIDPRGMDINKNYPLSKITSLTLVAIIDKLTMHISVYHIIKPDFLKKNKSVDGIQITTIVLFPDFEDSMIDVEPVVLPLRKPEDKQAYDFTVNIPVTATDYMIFCKVEACEKGIPISYTSSKGMTLEKTGLLKTF